MMLNSETGKPYTIEELLKQFEEEEREYEYLQDRLQDLTREIRKFPGYEQFNS